jgi:four helix bundle protein
LTLAHAHALALTPGNAQSQDMPPHFDHEKLKVYQAAIGFGTWSTDLLGQVTTKAAVKDQLDRASTSVPLNIAEGNGKFAIRDRCRFLDFARGSALECAACLDVLVAKRLVDLEAIHSGKQELLEIVSMLVGLIKSLSARIQEDAPSYSGRAEE